MLGTVAGEVVGVGESVSKGIGVGDGRDGAFTYIVRGRQR